jgi:hypothetical protein
MNNFCPILIFVNPFARIRLKVDHDIARQQQKTSSGLLINLGGLILEEAVPFWKRMTANNKGGKLPEFCSIHPFDESRIKNYLSSYKK